MNTWRTARLKDHLKVAHIALFKASAHVPTDCQSQLRAAIGCLAQIERQCGWKLIRHPGESDGRYISAANL